MNAEELAVVTALELPGWASKLIGESLVVAALLTVLVVAVKVWPVVRKLSRFLDDVAGEPARAGVPARPGIMERLSTVERELEELREVVAQNVPAIAGTLGRVEPAVAELHDAYVKPATGSTPTHPERTPPHDR